MSGAIDRTAITIKLNREVESKCYPPVKDFFNLLTDVLSGEVQGSFGDVIISNNVPSPDEVNKIWVEINGQRNTFIFKVYVEGRWQPWYFLPPNSIQFFDGRTGIPSGFKELGRFNLVDIPIAGATTAGDLPTDFIVAKWVGY